MHIMYLTAVIPYHSSLIIPHCIYSEAVHLLKQFAILCELLLAVLLDVRHNLVDLLVSVSAVTCRRFCITADIRITSRAVCNVCEVCIIAVSFSICYHRRVPGLPRRVANRAGREWPEPHPHNTACKVFCNCFCFPGLDQGIARHLKDVAFGPTEVCLTLYFLAGTILTV